jgi:hypothetical protein
MPACGRVSCLDECERFLKHQAAARRDCPLLAGAAAPDVWARIHEEVAWSRRALAALDAGQEVPEMPGETAGGEK